MSAIVDFYAGKTVFVTGVSGFLGKITLEKLLRTCRVQKVYVLLREKKGKSPSERLEEIFDGPAFSNLRKSGTEFKSKVTLLPGDLMESGLGLSTYDRRLLVENVEIVMHWAASINFHQNLKSATYTNVRSLREMINLAKEMTKLKAFLYVSTAYSNCHRTVLNEELYDFPVSGDNLIKIMDAVDEDMAAKLAPQLFSGSPNSYNFTKGAAEDLLKSEAGDLPICVLRPSIVIPTDTEPVPGYIDNMYGIIGITILIALGILRIVLCIKSLFAEIVPADFVMNAAFAATWDVARKREKNPRNREIPVFNFVLSNRYKLRIAEYVNYADTTCRFFPSEKCVWYPCYFFTSNRTLYKIGKVVLHYLPAYIGDFVFRCLGWKPLMVSGYRKIDTFADVLTYFTMRNWKFNDDKMWQLWDEMTLDDQKTFNFDLGKWTLDEYSPICAVGTRRYILKDPPETIPAGFRKYYKLMALHYVFVAVLAYLFYKLCSCLVNMVFY